MQRSAFLLHLALGAACGDAVGGASGSSGETGEPATTAAVTSTAAPTSTTTTSSTSSSSSGPDCPANTPPAAPELQEPLAGALFDQLSPAIMEDPRKEYGFDTFVNEHNNLQSFLQQRPDQIRDKLTAHGF